MAEATIPVDLRNPGQVFACLGLVEVADVLLGGAKGSFSWGAQSASFTVCSDGDAEPVGKIIKFLGTAKVTALRPPDSKLVNGKGIPTEDFPLGAAFPTTPPQKAARLLARIGQAESGSVILTYWGEVPGRARVKFWGGNRTAPGITNKALIYVAGAQKDDPFSHQADCEGVFRFDPRGSYLPLDSGFSLNNHKSTLTIQGFPVTEILAGVGLTYARPQARHKESYRYTVLGNTPPLSPMFLRAMIGTPELIIADAPARHFEFFVASPSASSEEYCITDVHEIPQETTP